MAATSTVAKSRPSSLVSTTLFVGLIIGIVGAIDYSIFFYLTQHTSPLQTYQYIASGLLGPASFAGGYLTALLGLVIHFFISFVVAGVFIAAANSIAFLRRTVWVSALIYGAAVNMFMSAVVLPFSAAPKMHVTTALIVHGLIGDALYIGLPLAITIWQGARARGAVAA